MSNARKLADNLPIDGHFGNRNIVINGNFTISQRGSYTSSTSVSDGTFYLDRWEYTQDGSPNSSLIHNTDGSVKITTGASVTGSSRLRQKFDYTNAPRQYDNKTFTVSAKVKSNTTNARINVYAGGYRSLTGTTAHSGGGSYETLTATFTTPSNITTEFSVHIGIDGASSANVSITSGQYFEVKEVQMEVGSQATPFEHEPIGVTLSKCQRYYEKMVDNLNRHRLLGVPWDTNSINVYVPYLVEKRTNPGVTVVSPGQTYKSGGWHTNTGSSVVGAGTRGCTLEIQVSNLTAGTGVFIRNQSLTIDAEL